MASQTTNTLSNNPPTAAQAIASAPLAQASPAASSGAPGVGIQPPASPATSSTQSVTAAIRSSNGRIVVKVLYAFTALSIAAAGLIGLTPTLRSAVLARIANALSVRANATAEWTAQLAFKQDCEARMLAAKTYVPECVKAVKSATPPPPYSYRALNESTRRLLTRTVPSLRAHEPTKTRWTWALAKLSGFLVLPICLLDYLRRRRGSETAQPFTPSWPLGPICYLLVFIPVTLDWFTKTLDTGFILSIILFAVRLGAMACSGAIVVLYYRTKKLQQSSGADNAGSFPAVRGSDRNLERGLRVKTTGYGVKFSDRPASRR